MNTIRTSEVERLFLIGHTIPDICRMLNASVDVVEDAIRDHLRDWRFKARQAERKKRNEIHSSR